MPGTFLMHYGTPGMKWGVRRYQEKGSSKRTPAGKKRYSHSSTGLAGEIYQNARKHEPKITKDVVRSIKSVGAKTYGLKNRLKTEDSLKRKIHDDSKYNGISITKAAKDVKDAIRYTALLDDDKFTEGYSVIKKDLENQGYTETRCRNYFDRFRKGTANHKQITSVYENADGTRFELQFHTPSSIKAKELKTPIYEEARRMGPEDARKASLVKQMNDLEKKVKSPKGVYGIKEHG